MNLSDLQTLSPAARAAVQAQLDASPTRYVKPREHRGGIAALAAARVPGRMTKTERRYADRLDALKAAGFVRSWKFERVNIKLDAPGSGRAMTYRPDFVVWHRDGRVTWDEVKGAFLAPAGIVKFRAAAEVFPEFHFRLYQWRDGAWTLMRESEGHESFEFEQVKP